MAPSTTPATTKPAAPPSGDRGSDWHVLNSAAPWAGRILTVNAIGRLLSVEADLSTTETETAVEVCRAGRTYVTEIGAGDATVAVYGRARHKLAEASGGGECRVVA